MTREVAQPSQTTRDMAKFVAAVVRNAMEDFHVAHLTDDQMRELNPIIRNAICTALHAAERSGVSEAANRYVEYHARNIPAYWEEPTLLEGYVRMEQRDAGNGSV